MDHIIFGIKLSNVQINISWDINQVIWYIAWFLDVIKTKPAFLD